MSIPGSCQENIWGGTNNWDMYFTFHEIILQILESSKVGDLQNELRSYLDMSSHVNNFTQELKLGVRNSWV